MKSESRCCRFPIYSTRSFIILIVLFISFVSEARECLSTRDGSCSAKYDSGVTVNVFGPNVLSKTKNQKLSQKFLPTIRRMSMLGACPLIGYGKGLSLWLYPKQYMSTTRVLW